MAEKESRSPLFKLFADLSAPWCSGVKRMAAFYIDTNEKLAKGAIDLQKRATAWVKDTPWAPLFEAQETLARQFVEGSASLTRSLWGTEKEGEAAKGAEG